MPTVQIQLILKLPSYYSSMYGKDEGEYSGAFTPDNENAEKSRLQF
jgi:hypothetical protein